MYIELLSINTSERPSISDAAVDVTQAPAPLPSDVHTFPDVPAEEIKYSPFSNCVCTAEVTPSTKLISAAVAVTPSMMFSSAAVAVTSKVGSVVIAVFAQAPAPVPSDVHTCPLVPAEGIK